MWSNLWSISRKTTLILFLMVLVTLSKLTMAMES